MDLVSFIMFVFGSVCLIVALFLYLHAEKIKGEAIALKEQARRAISEAEQKGSAALEQLVSAVRENSETVTKETFADTDINTFKGFPVADKSPEGVFSALRSHGFVFRWNNHNYREIGINYQDPKNSEADILREVYAVPMELIPANALHNERRADAALWAARQFKSDRSKDAPELNAYAYL